MDELRQVPAVQWDSVLDRVVLAIHHNDLDVAVQLHTDWASAKRHFGGHHLDHRCEHPGLSAQAVDGLAHVVGALRGHRSPRFVS